MKQDWHLDGNIYKLIVISKCSTTFQRAFKLYLKKTESNLKNVFLALLRKDSSRINSKGTDVCMSYFTHFSQGLFLKQVCFSGLLWPTWLEYQKTSQPSHDRAYIDQTALFRRHLPKQWVLRLLWLYLHRAVYFCSAQQSRI